MIVPIKTVRAIIATQSPTRRTVLPRFFILIFIAVIFMSSSKYRYNNCITCIIVYLRADVNGFHQI